MNGQVNFLQNNMKKKLSKEQKAKIIGEEMLANLKANVLTDQLSEKEKANRMTDELLEETLKQINKK